MEDFNDADSKNRSKAAFLHDLALDWSKGDSAFIQWFGNKTAEVQKLID